jgi:co-chaperonin GroES (HSP10)
MIPIRVLGDRVLVLLPPEDTEQDATTGYAYRPKDTTESGLILAQSPHSYDPDGQTRGIVAKLGDKGRVVDRDDVRRDVHEWFLEAEDNFAMVEGFRADTVDWRFLRDQVDNVLMKMAPAPFEVQVGDCVLFSASDGERVDYDGQRYVILREAELLGVVEPVAA